MKYPTTNPRLAVRIIPARRKSNSATSYLLTLPLRGLRRLFRFWSVTSTYLVGSSNGRGGSESCWLSESIFSDWWGPRVKFALHSPVVITSMSVLWCGGNGVMIGLRATSFFFGEDWIKLAWVTRFGDVWSGWSAELKFSSPLASVPDLSIIFEILLS